MKGKFRCRRRKVPRIVIKDKYGAVCRMMAKQGHVSMRCTMDGFEVISLVKKEIDPCSVCREIRTICGSSRRFGEV